MKLYYKILQSFCKHKCNRVVRVEPREIEFLGKKVWNIYAIWQCKRCGKVLDVETLRERNTTVQMERFMENPQISKKYKIK